MRVITTEMEINIYKDIAAVARQHGVTVDPNDIADADYQLSNGVELLSMKAGVHEALMILCFYTIMLIISRKNMRGE